MLISQPDLDVGLTLKVAKMEKSAGNLSGKIRLPTAVANFKPPSPTAGRSKLECLSPERFFRVVLCFMSYVFNQARGQ
jgi:hypothetical protein